MIEFLIGFYLGGMALQMFRVSQVPNVTMFEAAFLAALWPAHVYRWVKGDR